MGQHKTNPTAIAAKAGKIPPKPPNKTKREQEAEIHAAMLQALHKKGLDAPFLLAESLGATTYKK